MKPIVTLTLNPAIDASCQADEVRPVHKIRTSHERYDPGGGGINVARVIRELGGEALAVYTAGGLTGEAFDRMVGTIGLARRAIRIAGLTRVSHTVFERRSGQEYRFVPEGPPLTDAEWQAALAALATLDADYLVASGSLPQGVPVDFYARLAAAVRARGGRFVLDTSGEALCAALGAGVHLIKPSRGELERALGRSLREPAALEDAARGLVADGGVEIVAVSLGADGALLATRDGLPAPARAAGRGQERGRRGRQLRRRHDLRPRRGPGAARGLHAGARDRYRDGADDGHRALPSRRRLAPLPADLRRPGAEATRQ